MINYLKVDKAERSHVLNGVLAAMGPEQGKAVQNLALSLMYRDRRLDYIGALEIVMEIGVNLERMEDDESLAI